MGSKTFDGVWFISYSFDHAPPHVHGRYGGAQVVVELFEDGTVAQASRRDAVVPANAKRNDVRHILDTAEEHAAELMALWRSARG